LVETTGLVIVTFNEMPMITAGTEPKPDYRPITSLLPSDWLLRIGYSRLALRMARRDITIDRPDAS